MCRGSGGLEKSTFGGNGLAASVSPEPPLQSGELLLRPTGRVPLAHLNLCIQESFIANSDCEVEVLPVLSEGDHPLGVSLG